MKQDKSKKEEAKKSHLGTLVLIGILIAFSLITLFIVIVSTISSNSSNTGDSLTISKNCRQVQVPYEDTETYTETVPYQDTEVYNTYLNLEKVNAVKQQKIEFSSKGVYEQANVTIKNLDTEGGWVTVNFNWKNLTNTWKDSVRHYISPDETVDFISEFDIKSGEDNTFTYNYKSDPIQKTRIVTKYKEVENTRTVTKYRTEEQCD